jgi:hypothetical protein
MATPIRKRSLLNETILEMGWHAAESSATVTEERRTHAADAGTPVSADAGTPVSKGLVDSVTKVAKLGTDTLGTVTRGATKAISRKLPPTDADLGVQRRYEMLEIGCVIDPRGKTLVAVWDTTMLLALLFTAVVTPTEIVFLDEGTYVNELWVLNRIVDLLFTVDLVLSFFMAYQAPDSRGGHWVLNSRVIARRYLKGWFVLDLVSILPFWLLTLSYADPLGTLNMTETEAEDGLTRMTVLFRLGKLVRMIKLARIFKASRVLQRQVLDILLYKVELTYATIKVIKLITILVCFAHWQACLWGLASSYMAADGYPNWLSDFDANFLATMGIEAGPFDRYIAALHWSTMTLTSIGYGEMLPVNSTERALCIVLQLVSGVMWAWSIGTITAVATTLDPKGSLYNNTMDSLNFFMRDRRLPKEVRHMLRDYFQASRQVLVQKEDEELLFHMSPLLHSMVSLIANKKWLDEVWYLRGLGATESGRQFIARLSKGLKCLPYIQSERLPLGQMYILHKGVVVKNWRFYCKGRVWGDDFILENRELIDHSQAVALGYTEVYTLRLVDFRPLGLARAADRKACSRVLHPSLSRLWIYRDQE